MDAYALLLIQRGVAPVPCKVTGYGDPRSEDAQKILAEALANPAEMQLRDRSLPHQKLGDYYNLAVLRSLIQRAAGGIIRNNMKGNMTTETERSEEQAKAQLDSIREMVKALDTDNETEREEAQQTIHEDPLSVEVRSDWHTLDNSDDNKPSEYRILLCWGGPAVRIVGELNQCGEPDNARIEHQDWGTPWTEYHMTSEEEADVVTYARQFYFGE